MENLLHERLRKYASENDLDIYLNGTRYFIPFTNGEALALADEIERYYIPRPRFEDGYPVQLYDKFETASGEVCNVSSIGMSVCGLKVNPCSEIKSNKITLKEGEFVKRPTPKVLDADGEIIQNEDKGYNATTGEPLTVLFVQNDKSHEIFVRDEERNEYYIDPSNFTHQEPDSLEKLRDDINAWTERNDSFRAHTGKVTDGWANRLTALIERGA